LSTAAAVSSTTSRGSIDGPALKLYFFINLTPFFNCENNKKAREHKMPSCTKQQNNGIGIKLIAVFY
jgi:hypothetical protein